MARTVTHTATDNTGLTTATLKYCDAKDIEWSRSGGAYPPGELKNKNTNLPYLSAATQYYVNGDAVYLSTADAVTATTLTDHLPIAGFVTSGGDTTGATVIATGTQTRIMPVNAVDEYEMTVVSATAGNTARSSVALLVGNAYNLMIAQVTNDGGDVWYGCAVDLDAQTEARVKITDIVMEPDAKSTDRFIRVRVKFLPVMCSVSTSTLTPIYGALQL
jgi:hypothetical protein